MTDRQDIEEIGVPKEDGESWQEVADRRSGTGRYLVAYVTLMMLAVVAGYLLGGAL